MRIATLCGSPRVGSYTAKALAIVSAEFEAHGHEVQRFDMAQMSLNHPGAETTEDAKRLAAAIRGADAVVLATPEYHGSLSAALKLAIENMGFPSGLKGKPVAMLGVAAGAIGAIKSLEQLRSICAHVGAFALPGAVSVARVQRVFDDEGRCSDPAVEARLKGLAKALAEYAGTGTCAVRCREETVREELES